MSANAALMPAYWAELKSRGTTDRVGQFREGVRKLALGCFEKQANVLRDPRKFKSVRCPRGAGKSWVAITYALQKMASQNAARVFYICMTKPQLELIVWILLKELDEQYQLNLQFNETYKRVIAPNGSRMFLQGMDSKNELKKLRGSFYDRVVIDEAKDYSPLILKELLKIIRPRLADRNGDILLIGTPGNVCAGIFFDATTVATKGVVPYGTPHTGPYRWSFHNWTLQDNIHVPHNWAAALEYKAAHGLADDDPEWMTEYLGEWCPDADLMVYKFSEERDAWEPTGVGENEHGLSLAHDWQYVLGCDFGWEDHFAICVVAWSESSPALYQVWDYKARHSTVSDMAREITAAGDMFGDFTAMVCDTGNFGKHLMETLNGDHGFYFEPAEKKEKRDFITLLNSDLAHGLLKIRKGSNCIDDMEILQWADEHKRRENYGTPNDNSDALLYTWRFCQHHNYRKPADAPEEGTPEYARQQRSKTMDAYRKRLRDAEDPFAEDGDPWDD